VALVPMVTAETLGLKRFGTLFGWLGTVVTVGLFVGPLLVGWMADVTGSYTMPFELCALIALVGSTASFLCVVPQPAEIALVSQPSSSTSTV
jgi:MFS family permease